MKILFSLLLFVSFSLSVMAAETLTFKFSNPRVEYFAPDNYFTFDILVKASAGGSYLFASQVICNVTLPNFNSLVPPSAEKGAFIDGMFDPPGPASAQNKYDITSNWNSGNLNIAVTSNINFRTYAPASGAFSEVTTSYQKLCTVYCMISNPDGMAGISFQQNNMNGYQKFATGVGPLYSEYYTNPCGYEGYDFTDIYLERIFCGISGWTQYNGVVDWTLPVNTSVWDTTSAAALTGSLAVPDAKADHLRIHPTARMKVPEGRSFTCSGNTDIKEARGLILGAGATGRSQFLDNGTINYMNGGSVEAQAFFPQSKWHYYCIPLVQTQAWPYYHVYMKYFVENENKYKYVVAPDSLLATRMLGYAMWSAASGTYPHSGFVAPVGQLNTGAQSIQITRSASDGYNLIGNPYSSAIDLSLPGVNWGDCDPMAWFWDPDAGNYFVYLTSGGGTRSSSYCAASQGFFVHHSNTNTIPTTFGVDNSIRTINPEPFLKNEDNTRDLLQLKAESSSNTYFDKAVIRFTNDATPAYDEQLDALKLQGSYNAPQLFSLLPDLSKVSVNAHSWSGENVIVPLGFSCSQSADYSITAGNLESFNANNTIILEDRLLNSSQDLKTNPKYVFSATPGESLDRFFLHFTNPSFGTGELMESGMQIYSSGNILYVKNLSKGSSEGEVTVYDMLGHKVFNAQLNDTPVNSFQVRLNSGYYLVRIVSGNSTYSEKVLF